LQAAAGVPPVVHIGGNPPHGGPGGDGNPHGPGGGIPGLDQPPQIDDNNAINNVEIDAGEVRDAAQHQPDVQPVIQPDQAQPVVQPDNNNNIIVPQIVIPVVPPHGPQ
jgi:hypothetical protein